MKKLLLFLLFSFFILHFSFAQNDPCHLRVTLLTCSPGEELYSTFGHTAVRVQDQDTGNDYVFNYGTFQFDEDFNVKFIRGKLLYSLSIQGFDEFMEQYREEKRDVWEQELQLSCAEKEKLLTALFNNAREENRYYHYDFLFDNCTTRAGVIIEKNTSDSVVFTNILPANPPSFRDMIHHYLDDGRKYWSKLGIDILLGAKLDRKVTNTEAIHFLPDYLLQGFDHATVKGRPLVSPSKIILDVSSLTRDRAIFPSPFLAFGLFFVLVVLLSLGKRKWVRVAMSIVDFLFFFLLGLAGVLLLFMWFGTDHKVCQNNYNLFWALPTNTVMAFFVHSNKAWVKKYFRLVFWISILLGLTWFFLPQQMNNALLPVLLLIIYRTWRLSKTNTYGTKKNPA